MKKIYLTIFTLFFHLIIFSQAKKPTIMVVPSDDWCQANGFMQKWDNEGVETYIPNYNKALVESSDLNSVIAKIGQLFVDRGFPLVDLKSTLDKINKDQARTNMLGINESPIDVLNKTAKSDINLKVFWKINNIGPKRSCEFRLSGVDSYTNKQRAGASGTGKQTFVQEVSVLLEEAVLSYIDMFNSQLMTYFDDILANGREGALVILVNEMAENDLQTLYTLKGKEATLKDIVNRFWMPRNTVEGRYSMDENSENVMKFSQVRIPLYGDDGWGGTMAYDFETWGGNLKTFLKEELQIPCDIQTKGLGEVELILK